MSALLSEHRGLGLEHHVFPPSRRWVFLVPTDWEILDQKAPEAKTRLPSSVTFVPDTAALPVRGGATPSLRLARTVRATVLTAQRPLLDSVTFCDVQSPLDPSLESSLDTQTLYR